MLLQVGCCSEDKCVVVLHAQELGSILICNHVVTQYRFAAGSAAFALQGCIYAWYTESQWYLNS